MSPTRPGTSKRSAALALRLAAVGLAFLIVLSGCGTPSLRFDGARAYEFVKSQCNIGPRSAGTPGARAAAKQIADELTRLGWQVTYQDFSYRGVAVQNVIARRGQQSPYVLLGAHYDTRSRADQDRTNPAAPVPGASDGASGVAVLLELARVIGQTRQPVMLAFFDAEDQGDIAGWDWAVGSTYMASTLQDPLAAMILVDMVGDSDQQLYWEANSDPSLRQQLWTTAGELGYGAEFIPQVKHNLIDDHIPFIRRGIPSVDIIDFDYRYWHTTQDTPDKVSPASLERVGRVLEKWLTR